MTDQRTAHTPGPSVDPASADPAPADPASADPVGADAAEQLGRDVTMLLLSAAELCVGLPVDPWPDLDVTTAAAPASGSVLAALGDDTHPWHTSVAGVELARPRLLCAAGDGNERAWGRLWLLAEQLVDLEEDAGLALSAELDAQGVLTGIERVVAAACASPADSSALFDETVTAFTTLVTSWAAALAGADEAKSSAAGVAP